MTDLHSCNVWEHTTSHNVLAFYSYGQHVSPFLLLNPSLREPALSGEFYPLSTGHGGLALGLNQVGLFKIIFVI